MGWDIESIIVLRAGGSHDDLLYISLIKSTLAKSLLDNERVKILFFVAIENPLLEPQIKFFQYLWKLWCRPFIELYYIICHKMRFSEILDDDVVGPGGPLSALFCRLEHEALTMHARHPYT